MQKGQNKSLEGHGGTKVSPEGQISENGTKGQKQGQHFLTTQF